MAASHFFPALSVPPKSRSRSLENISVVVAVDGSSEKNNNFIFLKSFAFEFVDLLCVFFFLMILISVRSIIFCNGNCLSDMLW